MRVKTGGGKRESVVNAKQSNKVRDGWLFRAIVQRERERESE